MRSKSNQKTLVRSFTISFKTWSPVFFLQTRITKHKIKMIGLRLLK